MLYNRQLARWENLRNYNGAQPCFLTSYCILISMRIFYGYEMQKGNGYRMFGVDVLLTTQVTSSLRVQYITSVGLALTSCTRHYLQGVKHLLSEGTWCRSFFCMPPVVFFFLHDTPQVINGRPLKCPGLTCGINIVKPRFLFKTVDLWSYILPIDRYSPTL